MFKNLLSKYKEGISYIIFGVLTTLVNFIVYFFCSRFLNLPLLPSNFIAWFLSVLFAFLTNKFFVFNSKTTNIPTFLKEAFDFTLSRALTGALDMLLFNFLVLNLLIND
ncbi:MAG: GtrA family protein, partial [Clostridium sp.]